MKKEYKLSKKRSKIKVDIHKREIEQNKKVCFHLLKKEKEITPIIKEILMKMTLIEIALVFGVSLKKILELLQKANYKFRKSSSQTVLDEDGIVIISDLLINSCKKVKKEQRLSIAMRQRNKITYGKEGNYFKLIYIAARR